MSFWVGFLHVVGLFAVIGMLLLAGLLIRALLSDPECKPKYRLPLLNSAKYLAFGLMFLSTASVIRLGEAFSPILSAWRVLIGDPLETEFSSQFPYPWLLLSEYWPKVIEFWAYGGNEYPVLWWISIISSGVLCIAALGNIIEAFRLKRSEPDTRWHFIFFDITAFAAVFSTYLLCWHILMFISAYVLGFLVSFLLGIFLVGIIILGLLFFGAVAPTPVYVVNNSGIRE
ncbi:hypothetical protein [Pseudaestuariivita rosea]|uniref:hypothetical protein n=1 Tax=Pseudaestuariivita rosea TaxID=2763263 RepID=UPI001ABA43B8|nr:hypothetical protein [Pseudaestuariivita rosea]